MSAPTPALAARAIRIAVLAMGGEGGGVLANWLVDLGESNGYVAQMTSVPGVAQRTGATIYYIEMFPEALLKPGQVPVLSQMPVPGDVDLVIASELMEAGRAIQRGIVTPDRTTLVASSHRVFAMTEKIAMADGRVDENALLLACRTAARQFISFDMMAMAERQSSVVSAVMFGAVAGAGILPFARAQFEQTIREGGVGVKASLGAFAAAFDAGSGKIIEPPATTAAPGAGVKGAATRAERLIMEAMTVFPPQTMEIVRTGIEQCIDWQDGAVAELYIARLKPVVDLDRRGGDGSWRLTSETARQLALAMTYEDTIRVADLKIRASRFRRVESEVGLKSGQILQIREYLHPRVQEIAETVPAWLGHRIERDGWLRRLIERLTENGRVLETTSVRGFLQLYVVAGLKRWRRQNLRYQAEQASIEAWLKLVLATAARDYALGVETAELRTLVKGYGDTHARGSQNFARIAALVPQLSGAHAAKRLAGLRQAAVADDSGAKLTEALAGPV